MVSARPIGRWPYPLVESLLGAAQLHRRAAVGVGDAAALARANIDATEPKCRNTRIRHPLKSVVDSLKASFKIATTRGSSRRLASIFLIIKRFNTRTCSALMLDIPSIGCALLICTLCRLIWLSCDSAFSGDNMHGQACAELQLNAHVFHHCEI